MRNEKKSSDKVYNDIDLRADTRSRRARKLARKADDRRRRSVRYEDSGDEAGFYRSASGPNGGR